MKPRIYVETSVFSFYFDERPSAVIAARREWTRDFWDNHVQRYEAITSEAVLAELQQGTMPHREQSRMLAATLPVMPVSAEAQSVVARYIENKVMPRDPLGDAMHLALASLAASDYLLTWNCEHLANANKFGHIRTINTRLGLHVPTLLTPLELMGVSAE